MTIDCCFVFDRPVIKKIMERFAPDAIVLQCGADSLCGDKLGCFNLTLNGHAVREKTVLAVLTVLCATACFQHHSNPHVLFSAFCAVAVSGMRGLRAVVQRSNVGLGGWWLHNPECTCWP